MNYKIFGFEIRKAAEQPALAPAITNDGAIENEVSTTGAGAYGYYFDINKRLTNEIDLINKYRSMAQIAEIDSAIEDIVNEAIVVEEDQPPVAISVRTDNDDIPPQIVEAITEEFNNIVTLLDFHDNGHEIFRTWYVDGKIHGQIIVNEEDLSAGIQDIRLLDPRKIRKVRDIIRQKNAGGAVIVVGTEEYFMYNDAGAQSSSAGTGIKLSTDSIIYSNSGLTDEYNTPISFLHKAIKPSNHLRYMEDAALIYTLSRAPSRRVFYIDIADMPKQKADQYMQTIMAKYKNKIVYDSANGEIKDGRVHQTMMEDYWLPRRCFSLDTKVKLLDGRDVSIADLSIEYQEGKKNWTYSVSDDGTVVPGLITWAGTTMRDAEVVDVHLDNGEVITCTPDHKFILRNGDKIEAQYLSAGTSLMPVYTEKRVIYGKTEYEHVLDNKTNTWVATHRLVKKYFDGKTPFKNVIHHADFNRFNNNPENLVFMDRAAHFKLHSHYGTKGWENATPEKRAAWIQNLSNATTQFFQTPRGEEVKLLISENNKTDAVLNGSAKGRETIARNRQHDKATMSAEDYVAKWVTPVSESRRKNHMELLSSYDINLLISEIRKNAHPMIRNRDVVEIFNKLYPGLKLEAVRSVLRHYGYETISDFICRNFSDIGLSPRRKYQSKNADAKNHRVVKVVRRTDRMDVGTLTVDGDEKNHSYHNYALTAGVFVMNSNGKTTEIQTLPSESISGQMDNVTYFLNKLYAALNIPLSRLQSDTNFNLGRSQEITRDEIKFSKFIDRMRKRFSTIFLQALRVQLILKGIITPEDWDFIRSRITIDYLRDNHFAELKESEILSNRLQMVNEIMPLVGRFYSSDYVRKHVLRQTEEEIEKMQEEIMKNKDYELLQQGAPE